MTTAGRGIDVLQELRSGRREAVDHLFAIVYDELREIARRQRAVRDKDGTLDTTGLVHEAYLNLVDQSRASWNDRAHFVALAAVAMRHILADRAKARVAVKRGGARRAITLDEQLLASDDQPEALLQYNDALDRQFVSFVATKLPAGGGLGQRYCGSRGSAAVPKTMRAETMAIFPQAWEAGSSAPPVKNW